MNLNFYEKLQKRDDKKINQLKAMEFLFENFTNTYTNQQTFLKDGKY
jgi:hypothetical protein